MRRRLAILVGCTLLAATFFTSESRPAAACICMMPVPAEHRIGMHDVAFVGTPRSDRTLPRTLPLSDGPGVEDRDLWTIQVDETFKGILPESVDILTRNDYGDCGTGPFEAGVPLAILATLGVDGRLHSNSMCGWSSITEADLRARSDLPDSTGRGPITDLVMARDHDASVIALNAAREVVGYGFSAGEVRLIAPCPGGTTFVTLTTIAAGERIDRWDAASLTSERLAGSTFDDRSMGYPSELLCADGSGDATYVLSPNRSAWRVADGGLEEVNVDGQILGFVPTTPQAVVLRKHRLNLVRLDDPWSRSAIATIPDEFDPSGVVVGPGSERFALFEWTASSTSIAEYALDGTAPRCADLDIILHSPLYLDENTIAGLSEHRGNLVTVDLTTGRSSVADARTLWLSSFGDGSILFGSPPGGNALVRAADGTESRLLPNAWEVRSVTPFAGPEVTPEAAARVRADDLDLTRVAEDNGDGPGITSASGDGTGLVPIAVSSVGVVVALAGVVIVRRRRHREPPTA